MFPEYLNFDGADRELEEEEDLLYNETSYLYDFDKGDFVYKNGNPVLVRGREAIKIWAEKALRTRIYTYDIYDETDEEGLLEQREYGSNIWRIIRGNKFPELMVHAETKRDVEETLSYNDKIKGIEDYEIELGTINKSHLLKISFKIILVNDEELDMEVKFNMEFKKLVDAVHRDMLLQLHDKFDKSTGSFAYDILRPPSYLFIDAENKLKEVDSKRSMFNLSGEDLDVFISQFTPIRRREATAATGYVTITGKESQDVYRGTLVASASHQYKTVEFIKLDSEGNGKVLVECTVKGSEGNAAAGLINQFPITVRGLETVTNEEPITEGYNREDDDTLRKRYFDYINLPATSGNVYHYLLWAGEIDGVAATRVHPLWNGDNTVKLVIIDSNGQPASPELVSAVQEYIDPIGEEREDGSYTKWGCGYGEAPVGAFCTVVAANEISIKVEVEVIFEPDTDINTVINEFKYEMIDRFSSIALDDESRVVSVAKVGYVLLGIPGVRDYRTSTLMLNGSQENINLEEDDVAVFDEVILNEI